MMPKLKKILTILAILTLTAGIVTNKETFRRSPWDMTPEQAWQQEYQSQVFYIASLIEDKQLGWTLAEYQEFAEQVVELSLLYQTEPSLLLAVIDVESQFDPCAVSRRGAKGLMQVRPTLLTGEAHEQADFSFAHHLYFDSNWNLGVGAKYLHLLHQEFGNMEQALAAYNMGPTRFRSILRRRGELSNSYAEKVLDRERWYSDQIGNI